jgi:glycogen debranching enzyme
VATESPSHEHADESTLSFEEVAEHVEPLFEYGDETIRRFTIEVYRQCVLGKVFPPRGYLRHPWISPGGGYAGQWIWDTLTVLDLLAIVPGQRDVIRGVFQNYWDFQERWNPIKPPVMHDMVPCMMFPDESLWGMPLSWREFPAYSQAPLIAWGLERVHARNGDDELVARALDPLERFHEWYWRERDVTDVGMVTVGCYRGATVEARNETFDCEADLDDLALTRHPGRPEEDTGYWYGDILIPANTAYLINSERSLARLAEQASRPDMAARRTARADRALAAMNEHMWDEHAGLYLAVRRDTLEQVRVPTIGGWVPLWADVPGEARAARMAQALDTPNWMTPMPIPTVGRFDPRWRPADHDESFWRGDVWVVPNYHVASGLARYGHRELAARIADTTIATAIEQGINERYDADTGRPSGVENLGMSSATLTMILDGLASPRFALSVKVGATA